VEAQSPAGDTWRGSQDCHAKACVQ